MIARQSEPYRYKVKSMTNNNTPSGGTSNDKINIAKSDLGGLRKTMTSR